MTKDQRVAVNWGGRMFAGTFIRYRTKAERKAWRRDDDVMIKLDGDTIALGGPPQEVPFRVFNSSMVSCD